MVLTAYGRRGPVKPADAKHLYRDKLPIKKTLLVMKLTILLLIGFCFGAQAKTYSQKVTLSEQNVPLQTVFAKIERQTGYTFVYRDEWMDRSSRVSVSVTNASLEQALAQCFREQPLTYSIVGRTVVVKQKAEISQVDDAPPIPVIDISGIVTDNQGEPLSGASVVVQGTQQGTSTDGNGHFLLRGIDEKATLVISYVGYSTKSIAVNSRRSLTVQLDQAPDPLNETIVIGYGTTTRRKSTGSISSISSEEISKQPVGNPLNTLQGRIPGAVVFQSNGLPGSRVTIQIRGVNSLNSGQQPLYIIDGVPFNIMDQAVPASNDLNSFGIFAANRGISPFATINPNDIERIDVLKDADATSIYGTKAANGVVLITTKKGQAGKTRLDVNVYRGEGKVSRFIPMMNTQQYLEMRKDAFAAAGVTPTTGNAPDLLLWDQNQYTNWQEKYMGGTAHTTDAQATISGGDVRTRFLFSSGYHKETTVFPGDFSDDRLSVRFNADHSSYDRKFNAVATASYVFNNSNLLSTDLSNVYNLPPNMPIQNADGSLFWNTNFTNPDSYLYQTYIGKINNLLANTVFRYTILPGLDLKTSLSFNDIGISQNLQQPVISKNPIGTTPTHSARFANLSQQTYTVEPQATYSKNIWDGRLMLLAGGTWQSSLNKGTSINADNYSNAGLLSSPAGAGNYTSIMAPYTLYRYNSFFGRFNYDWQSKYILNINFRRDGSSRFGPGHRFGNFGSVGGAWVFSNENFLAKAIPFLSFGKIRGSYGLTGSDQIQDYQYITLFSGSSGNLGYQGAPTLSPSRIDNPDLHWETNKKFELGLDLGFVNDRFQLTANYYRNRSGNQLGYLQLSSQAGFNAYQSNFDALIENKGWEFEVNSKNVTTNDFEWRTSFNLTVPSTKLLEASDQYFYFNQQALGQPLSYVMRFNYEGVDPQTGRPLFRDYAKDSVTFTPAFGTDRSIVGYSAPKFYGGISNVLSYKGLELSFFFQFSRQDGNILPGSIPGGLSTGNVPTLWLDRWRKPGDNSTLPAATTISSFYYGSSDALWGDASYARLRNAVLSYRFPQAVISKMKLSNLRLYLQGQNLVTWTKNKYVSDPETIATINQSPVVMPPLRVITAGINCSF
ncbi:MAG: SusC/RagA family TonB-linked outer membrane protein [Flavisolibacter sp.]